MHALTRFAFAVSDAVAWLVIFCLVFVSIPITFFLPLYAAMDHEEAPSLEYVATLAGVQLAMVVLFYATARRKTPAAVILCLGMPPAWVWMTKDNPVLSLCGAGVFLAVFALPYGLAWYSMQQKKKESQTHPASTLPDA